MRRRATIGLLLAALAGCTVGPKFVDGPTVERNPNPAVPLAAVVRFASDQPVSVTLTISDGERSWEHRYGPELNPADGLPVLGMKADREHAIGVRIESASGVRTTELSYRTPPLPDGPDVFPPIKVTVSKPERMEPGFTVFNPRRSKAGDPRFGTDFGMLIAVDHAGDVLWYYRGDSRISDFERLRNGNLIYVTFDHRLVEIDWLGNPIRQWYAGGRPQGPVEGAIRVPGTLTFHHEVDELPNGNLVVLGSEVRELKNWYTSETDPRAPRRTQPVMGDVILEFNRETGEVVWEWRAFDALPTDRLAWRSFVTATSRTATTGMPAKRSSLKATTPPIGWRRSSATALATPRSTSACAPWAGGRYAFGSPPFALTRKVSPTTWHGRSVRPRFLLQIPIPARLPVA